MVLRDTFVLAGIALGVLASWIASSLLKTRLFGLTPRDPWSIGLSVAATLLVTMSAGYIPARRASRVDPMVALKARVKAGRFYWIYSQRLITDIM